MVDVQFPSGITDIKIPALTQWDSCQRLRITGLDIDNEVCQAHFCNKTSNEAIVKLVNAVNGGYEVDIPNRLLEDKHDIFAFIYTNDYEVASEVNQATTGTYYTNNGSLYDAVALPEEFNASKTYYKRAGRTIRKIVIPVIPRAKPVDYLDAGDPTEEALINEFIRLCNNVGSKAEDYSRTVNAYVNKPRVQGKTLAEYNALASAGQLENGVIYCITDTPYTAYINGAATSIVAVKGDKGEKGDTGAPETGQIGRVLKKVSGADAEWVQGKDIVYEQSLNLYDASKQTPETISPHYYVSGEPYSNTQYDGSFNCTAPIEVSGSTTYTIGLVPKYADIEKPWQQAAYGVFFYTKDGTFISETTANTFTTPANASYLRFNFAKGVGILLERLNERCVMVEGTSLPAEYEGYNRQTLEDKFGESNSPIYYSVEGRQITVVSKYSKTQDIVFTLACKGGNNLFDFSKVGVRTNTAANVSAGTGVNTYLVSASGDWHAPFVMEATTNIDGDNLTSNNFTGGNHQYNNSDSGSTATARCAKVRFFADNREVTEGSGYTKILKIEWTNFVQAKNTTKANGSGREVLQENHRLTFDGKTWETFVELIPLEQIKMKNWYGLQSTYDKSYVNVCYPGGKNRGVYTIGSYSSSANGDCCQIVAWGNEHRMIMEVDTLYDLGKRELAPNITNSAFTETYKKSYFSIINGSHVLNAGERYYLRGKYIFEAV